MAEYALLKDEAQRTEARIFFADEAHSRTEAELRGKWAPRGQPALVDSTSPQYGEKANCYSAVCPETGDVEWMELEGNSNSGTSVDFLMQLRGKHPGPLRVIWDNAPAPPASSGVGGGAGVLQDAWSGAEASEPAGPQPGPQCR